METTDEAEKAILGYNSVVEGRVRKSAERFAAQGGAERVGRSHVAAAIGSEQFGVSSGTQDLWLDIGSIVVGAALAIVGLDFFRGSLATGLTLLVAGLVMVGIGIGKRIHAR